MVQFFFIEEAAWQKQLSTAAAAEAAGIETSHSHLGGQEEERTGNKGNGKQREQVGKRTGGREGRK